MGINYYLAVCILCILYYSVDSIEVCSNNLNTSFFTTARPAFGDFPFLPKVQQKSGEYQNKYSVLKEKKSFVFIIVYACVGIGLSLTLCAISFFALIKPTSTVVRVLNTAQGAPPIEVPAIIQMRIFKKPPPKNSSKHFAAAKSTDSLEKKPKTTTNTQPNNNNNNNNKPNTNVNAKRNSKRLKISNRAKKTTTKK